MTDRIVVFYDNADASSAPVRKVISAVRHEKASTVDYRATAATGKLDVPDYAVAMLVGTAMIKKFLGAKISGRNSAMKKDGVWYLTLPNMNALYMKDVAIRAAQQFIKAIDISKDPVNYALPVVKYVTLSSVNSVQEFVNEALKSEFMSFDFETNNELQPHSPTFRCTCLGMMFNPNSCFVVPQELLYTPEVVQVLTPLFQKRELVKIAHNLSFDIKLLLHLGIIPKGQYACTKLMSWLVDENTPNGLKDFVDHYLPNYSGYDYGITFVPEANTHLYKYLAVDCFATLTAYCVFLPTLVEDKHLYVCFRNLYMSGAMVLKDLEWEGCNIDIPYLQSQIEYTKTLIEQREAELQDFPEVKGFVISQNEILVNKEVADLKAKIENRKIKFTNPEDRYIIDWGEKIKQYRTGELFCIDNCDFASTKVLAELLYSKHGFGFPKPMVESRSPSGKKIMVESNSTDKDALNDISHPIGEKLRIIRTLKLMLSTFYESILEKSIDGKLYAKFNQTGTVTGRLSSSDPNMQNIPARVYIDDDELKSVIKGVKKAIVAPTGHKIVQADLSQAELRVIGHYSKDENMITSYKNKVDLHAVTGSRIAKMQDNFQGFLEHPDFKKYRTIAKSANFGLVYGIGADSYIEYVKGMTGQTITPADEKVHRAAVFSAFPKLLKWHTDTELEVRKNGFVRTIFGVKRRLPEIFSDDKRKIGDAIRYAINSPIQGTIGGYAIWVMVWLRMRLPKEVRIINTVHDSIVFVVPDSMLLEVKKLIEDTAENIPFSDYFAFPPLILPLVMDVEAGINYGSLEEIS